MDSCARLCLLLALFSCAAAFYLPGLAPTNFCEEKVQKVVGKETCKVGVCDLALVAWLTAVLCYPRYRVKCSCT